tara:strand:- start:216 stop:707 length:492 start_codon:yes stop_codon:yes gene_type:complete
MAKMYYFVLYRLFTVLRNWTHKHLENELKVWNTIEETGNIKVVLKIEQERHERIYNKKLPKCHKIFVECQTKEQIIAESKELIIRNEDNREFFERRIKTAQDTYWWRGIIWTHNSPVDRIRRYFGLYCGHRGKKNWLSDRWIDVCEYLELKQIHFSYKYEDKY